MPSNKLLQRVYVKNTSEVGRRIEIVKSIIALEVVPSTETYFIWFVGDGIGRDLYFIFVCNFEKPLCEKQCA